MNPDDLIKVAPTIAQGATALAAAVPFTSIVKRMLGPAADELAEMWRDQVRVYRYGRQLKLLEKAERMAQEAGFTPQPVPPKILFPLLEGASFEDDENLHDMWAALLTNAASSKSAGKVRPGFIATLKQMAPDEAALLTWMFEQRTGIFAGPFNEPIAYIDLLNAHHEFTAERKDDPFGFNACIQGLHAVQLVEPQLSEDNELNPLGSLRPPYSLTFRGLSFMYACRAPKSKQ